MKNSILIVDDEPGVISALQRSLVEEAYTVYTAKSGIDGLGILNDNEIKMVISDEKMPGMAGSEFLAAVKKMFPDTVRIMLTGHASVQSAMKAVNSGEIYRFFAKPWNDIELKLAIRSAIEKYDLEAANRILLKTVKRQSCEIDQLEKLYPGITSINKDEQGTLILQEVTEKDFTSLLSEIKKESGEGER